METDSQLRILTGHRDRWARVLYSVFVSVIDPLIRQWRLGLGVFLAIGVLSILLALRISYRYEATASLLVSPPAYQKVGPSAEFMPTPLDIPTYAHLLVQPGILQEVCDRLGSENPELWADLIENDTLVPDTLEEMVSIETEVIEKTPQNVTYSRVLTLTARTRRPERSKHLLDVWVEVCTKRVREYNDPGTEATIEFIRKEHEDARIDVEQREDKLKEFQLQNDIDLKTALREQYQTKYTAYMAELRELGVELAEKEERLRVVKEQLTGESQTLILRRSPSNDAVVIGETVRPGSSSDSKYPVFEDEILNAVWASLREDESRLSTEISGLTARRAAIEQELAVLQPELEQLRAQIVDLRLRESRLQNSIEIGMAYYQQLARQREDMAALESNLRLESSSSVVVANPAVLPGEPKNALLRWGVVPVGFVLGALAAVAAANLRHELLRIRRSLKSAPEGAGTAQA